MKKKATILFGLMALLTGCAGLQQGGSKNAAAQLPGVGIFKTTSRGDAWVQKGDLYNLGGQPQKLNYTSIKSVKLDPQDANTLYLATDMGLYYSYSRGEGWFGTLQGKGVINDVVIHPKDKCTLYAAAHNQIFKSVDCARSWQLIHFTTLANQFFTSLLISNSDSRIIFAGASDGALLVSRNSGTSWEVLKFFDTPITMLMNHPNQAESFYLVSQQFGIQKTPDQGSTWVSLNDFPVHAPSGEPKFEPNNNPVLLRNLPGANTFFDLKFDSSQKDGLIYASAYGIFRLIDGEYWQEVEILNKPQQSKVNVVVIDPTDGRSIYFATQGALYRSENAGIDWSVKPLPSSGIPISLFMSPDSRNELYLIFNPVAR